MTTKNLYCLLFLLLCAAGCRTSSPGNNDVSVTHTLDFDKALQNPEEVGLSSVASSLKYIPLETNDSLLLDENLSISINDAYILVWSGKNDPTLFGTDGRYINRVGRYGKGPGELSFWHNRILDPETRSVIYWEGTKRITYSFDGTCRDITDFSGNLAKDMTDSTHRVLAIAGQATILPCGTSGLCSLIQNICYASNDGGRNFKITETSPITSGILLDEEIGQSYIMTQPNILNDRIGIFDYETGTYRYFYCDGHTRVPYRFKYKEGFTPRNGKSVLMDCNECGDYIFININNTPFIYNKKEDRLTAVRMVSPDDNQIGRFHIFNYLVNDIDPGMDFKIRGVTGEGNYYGLISAIQFRAQADGTGNPELIRMAEKMNDDDNQVVVIATPKK